MQKVFNVFSTISFVGVLAIGGAAGYVYLNQESIKERITIEITGLISDAVGGAMGDLPGLLNGDVKGEMVPTLPAPSSPSGTGLPVPF
mgnify:CR=1 FL=1